MLTIRYEQMRALGRDALVREIASTIRRAVPELAEADARIEAIVGTAIDRSERLGIRRPNSFELMAFAALRFGPRFATRPDIRAAIEGDSAALDDRLAKIVFG